MFGRDSLQAINSTPLRRTISLASGAVLVLAAIVFGATAPWGLWPALVLLEALVFAFLRNHWANKDALAPESNG
jgi:hypothetical protein